MFEQREKNCRGQIGSEVNPRIVFFHIQFFWFNFYYFYKEENKPSNSQQNKPNSPVRKPRSLERIPRLQKQQMSEERKANSIERQKQKKGYVSKGNCMDFCFL